MRLQRFVFVWCVSAGVAAARGDTKPLYDYQELTLDNGLRVITCEDFSCPIVAVQLWYHVGSKDEDPQRQGFAHMFEHMMFRGTDRLGPTDHFDLIRRHGGDCNAYTSFDNTTYVQTLQANQLELALWLEAERMTFLKIDQEAFDTERKVVEEERRLGLNRPFGTAPEMLLEELLRVHPYRWTPIGKIPHLRAASVDELRSFWKRFYVPNNATLVIVGAVEHTAAQALAGKCFGWIPRCPDPPRVTVQEPPQTAARTIELDVKNAPTSVCGVLFRTVPLGHADYPALQLLASILGGGESSRLYRELVDDEQLAVVALAATQSLEHDGGFAAGAVLSPVGGSTKKVLRRIEAQLERLRTEPVPEAELLKARNQLRRSVVAGTLTVESKARELGTAAVLEGDTARVNARLAEIERLTAADLLRVAQTHLAEERINRVTVERNLLGALFGKTSKEEDAPITATPEKAAPPPGRDGVSRPADYPAAPPIAAAIDAKLTPETHVTTLPNGLRVAVIPNGETPFVSVTLYLRRGTAADGEPGAASLAMGLLTKGTEQHTAAELADELETYAISLSGSASLDSSSVSASCLNDQLERTVGLLAEVMRTPTFPEAEFEKLRRQVRTGLAISAAEPGYIADRELRRRLYGGHAYARTPTGEPGDVDALTVEQCREVWRLAADPGGAMLIFAGDVAPERAVELATAAFGDWSAAAVKPAGGSGRESPPAPPSATRIYLVDHAGVQSQIRIGQLSGVTRRDAGWAIARVVSGYFGEAFNARLNETIRVKKGLTYGARGGFSAQRDFGEFRASTFSKTESTVEAVRAVLEEVRRLRDEPPSEKELRDTQSYIVGSFPGDRETPQAIAGDLWLIESNGLSADYFDRLLGGVRAATAEDCAQLARATIDPERLVIVVVGSAARLREPLAELAPVEVVKPGAVAATVERPGRDDE